MVKMNYLCRFEGLKSYKILTPIGPLNLNACNDGVHDLNLDESIENRIENENQQVCFANSENAVFLNVSAVQTLEWLKIYFENPAKTANVKLLPKFCFWPKDSEEANFTIQVWKRLCTINSGETVTYAELADLSGNAKASRAVGQAMRTNPVVLMVPCHRVIPKGYGVGNYACGRPKIKEWLIQHEKSVK